LKWEQRKALPTQDGLCLDELSPGDGWLEQL